MEGDEEVPLDDAMLCPNRPAGAKDAICLPELKGTTGSHLTPLGSSTLRAYMVELHTGDDVVSLWLWSSPPYI